MIKISDINLVLYNGEPTVSSREVAERFEKQHSEVLKKIAGYDRNNNHVDGILDQFEPSVNTLRYIIPSEYVDSKGEKRKEYLLTRDGFSLVVMGFTGAKALEWKLKYIEAFNKMEKALQSDNKALPITYKEALVQLLEQVERNEQLELENKTLLPKASYHDEVLNKDGLITTTIVAKDLGLSSASKLNTILFLNRILYKTKDKIWVPYSEYEFLIADGYADYKSYEDKNAKLCLKWTEKGRSWIIHNYETWKNNVDEMEGCK